MRARLSKLVHPVAGLPDGAPGRRSGPVAVAGRDGAGRRARGRRGRCRRPWAWRSCYQTEQPGTGHAVLQARDALYGTAPTSSWCSSAIRRCCVPRRSPRMIAADARRYPGAADLRTRPLAGPRRRQPATDASTATSDGRILGHHGAAGSRALTIGSRRSTAGAMAPAPTGCGSRRCDLPKQRERRALPDRSGGARREAGRTVEPSSPPTQMRSWASTPRPSSRSVNRTALDRIRDVGCSTPACGCSTRRRSTSTRR